MDLKKEQEKEEIGQAFREKQSRGEKKTKKALENFGFEKIKDISRIRFQKTKNVVFIINQPEVFRSFTHSSFLIFGEARMESIVSPSELQNDRNEV